MPPFSRYWFVYVLAAASLAALGVLALYLWRTETPQNGFVFLTGALVATLAFLSNSWSQWKTSKIQHTLTALQTLRTDKEYLANSGVVVSYLRAFPDGVPETEVAELLRQREEAYAVERPNAGQAVFFVLNQYEFIAAGVEHGAMDLALLRRTVRSTLCQLVERLAPLIAHLRSGNPAYFSNLVALYHALSPKRLAARPALGPRRW